MPTTTNFGWTTPADTDLVKNGASAMRTLGNGIDTTMFAQLPYLAKQSQKYYRTMLNGVTPAAVSSTEDVTHYTPIYFPNSCTLDRIVCRTGSTFSGTATVRLGIYNNTNGLPSTVLLDAGTVSATAASTDYSITISQAITGGWYWLAFNSQTNATTNTFQSVVATNGSGGNGDLGGNSTSGSLISGYTQNTVTGAFATATSLSAASTSTLTWIRVQ